RTGPGSAQERAPGGDAVSRGLSGWESRLDCGRAPAAAPGAARQAAQYHDFLIVLEQVRCYAESKGNVPLVPPFRAPAWSWVAASRQTPPRESEPKVPRVEGQRPPLSDRLGPPPPLALSLSRPAAFSPRSPLPPPGGSGCCPVPAAPSR